MPGLHHVELWVDDVAGSRREWGWLLERLGYELQAEWAGGFSYGAGGTYLTFTDAPGLVAATHDRRRPGLNHLAFSGGSHEAVDGLMADAAAHGWRPLYQERYPHAGGPDHYAGWLENSAGFKAEVVADRSGR